MCVCVYMDSLPCMKDVAGSTCYELVLWSSPRATHSTKRIRLASISGHAGLTQDLTYAVYLENRVLFHTFAGLGLSPSISTCLAAFALSVQLHMICISGHAIKHMAVFFSFYC